MNTKTKNKPPQTAVQWLDEQITAQPSYNGYVKIHLLEFNELVVTAKDMEEELQAEAYQEGYQDAKTKAGITSETY